ncbi:MAG: SDR family oxidoreductase [Ilumatobacteraceae bacterium]|nr:SDR family oxidoreductase [Ilumatobacteraceae bacterium]
MARILITGSNSGFGMLTALSLAKDGHDVVATMRDTDKGDDLRTQSEGLSGSVEIRQLDVGDAASIAAATVDADTVDVLVNNAGFEVQASVAMLDDDLLTRQFDTNVLGPVRLIRAVLPAWIERGGGTIVNVSSVAGVVGTPYGGAYAASKHALEALSEALHFETSQQGIRVRLIEPGRFDTGFGAKMIRPASWVGSDDEARCERFRASLFALDGDSPDPDPQEVADAIVHAALDADAPFRQFVGTDSQLISGAKASMSFEDFEATMRNTIDWHE